MKTLQRQAHGVRTRRMVRLIKAVLSWGLVVALWPAFDASSLGAEGSLNDDDQTPMILVAASERNYLPEVQAMLAHGVNINLEDVNGNSAVSASSENGHKELTGYLLSRGADRSKVRPLHHSPFVAPTIQDDEMPRRMLIWAVGYGFKDIVELLLSRGVDVNSTDASGNNAIAVAAGRDDRILVELLAKKGADLNLVSGVGQTPIEYALTAGGPSAAELLYQLGGRKQSDELEWYPDKLYDLISGKAIDIEAKEPNTELTLLMSAALQNHPKTIRFLVRKGAKVGKTFFSTRRDNRMYNGSTALIFALRDTVAREAALELIALKSPLDALNQADESAIHASVYHGDLEMVKALLDAGANVNLRDSFGHTPLYHAMMNDDAEMIQFLRSKGGQ